MNFFVVVYLHNFLIIVLYPLFVYISVSWKIGQNLFTLASLNDHVIIIIYFESGEVDLFINHSYCWNLFPWIFKKKLFSQTI